MSKTISVGGKCVVCGQDVVAVFESVSQPFHTGMMVGGEGKDVLQLKFACSGPGCALLYLHPPGVPDGANKAYAEFGRQQESERKQASLLLQTDVETSAPRVLVIEEEERT